MEAQVHLLQVSKQTQHGAPWGLPTGAGISLEEGMAFFLLTFSPILKPYFEIIIDSEAVAKVSFACLSPRLPQGLYLT